MSGLNTRWRKSSRSSTNGSCVEVRRATNMIQIRDTKDRGGPVLSFEPHSWQGFITEVRAGNFDR